MNGAPFRRSQWIGPVLLGTALAVAIGRVGAESPVGSAGAVPIPGKVLAEALREYVKDLTPLVADEAKFGSSREQIVQLANAVIPLAQSLGNQSEAVAPKGATSAIAEWARELAQAENYADAKRVADLLAQSAQDGAVQGAAPAWEDIASIDQVMEEAASIGSRLRRNLRRLERTKDDNIRSAATLAAFAQSVYYDVQSTTDGEDVKKWRTFSLEMRDAACELLKHYQSGDEAAIQQSLERLDMSCDACHEVFSE